MKNLVYLNKKQLFNWANTKSKTILYGFGYEWPGESIIHAFVEPPGYKMTAYPVAVFFKYIDDVSEVDIANFTSIIANEIVANNKEFSGSLLGILLIKGGIESTVKAYLQKNNTALECDIQYIPNESELYSRSKGLLETGALANKKVLIIGLGSFGSNIAVELAKAGVGNFSLVDFDRLELSNVSRHVCGINELGRFKTHAIKDAILQKNPFAGIETTEVDINTHPDLLKQLMQTADITICVTDNNRSRFNINAIAIEINKVVLFGRAITRAEGGDVYRVKGNRESCYGCLVGDDALMQVLGEEEISSRKQADETLPAYTTMEEREAKVQVGLSSDISPICNMLVKLALTELAKNTNSGISSLEQEFSFNYYLWANRRERQYANWGVFDNSVKKPTILRWYGVKVPKNILCMSCASKKENE